MPICAQKRIVRPRGRCADQNHRQLQPGAGNARTPNGQFHFANSALTLPSLLGVEINPCLYKSSGGLDLIDAAKKSKLFNSSRLVDVFNRRSFRERMGEVIQSMGEMPRVDIEFTDDICLPNPNYQGYGNYLDISEYGMGELGLKKESQIGAITFKADAEDAHWFTLEKCIDRIDRRHDGLGDAILAALETITNSTVGAWTPTDTYNTASWWHWSGLDDDKSALAEHLANEGDEETYVSIKQFHQGIPEWVHNPKPKIPLSRFKDHDLAAAALDLVRDCKRLNWPDQSYALEVGCKSINRPWFLRWKADDMTLEMADNQFHYEMEGSGEHSPYCFVRLFEWNEKNLAHEMTKLKQFLSLLQRTHQFIKLIGEPHTP